MAMGHHGGEQRELGFQSQPAVPPCTSGQAVAGGGPGASPPGLQATVPPLSQQEFTSQKNPGLISWRHHSLDS
jgi:hypothetical protein